MIAIAPSYHYNEYYVNGAVRDSFNNMKFGKLYEMNNIVSGNLI